MTFFHYPDSNPSVKKNRKKDTYLSKKKKEAANEDEGEQDSDEEEEFDNVESKECDYMSESSSSRFICSFLVFVNFRM